MSENDIEGRKHKFRATAFIVGVAGIITFYIIPNK